MSGGPRGCERADRSADEAELENERDDPGELPLDCYHHYPAHAAFGGYKASGVGRENHRMMLDHYSQTKCLLVSYDPNPMGFF